MAGGRRAARLALPCHLIILMRSGAHDQVQGLRISIIRIVMRFSVMLAPPVAAGAPRAPWAVWCA